MKTITYHYVRKRSDFLPHFVYLDINDFELQLEYFRSSGGIVSSREFMQFIKNGLLPQSKYLLTFDDGLRDHLDAARLLSKNGEFGIFYISAGPYTTERPLAVHIVHTLLGRINATDILSTINSFCELNGISTELAEFEATYSSQTNPPALTQVKRLLNYRIPYQRLDELIDQLCDVHLSTAKAHTFSQYLSLREIEDMQKLGMYIGAHGVSHKSLARLPEHSWKFEVTKSLDFISGIKVGDCPLSFAYPYGGSHNYPSLAPSFLKDNGCQFSFDVNHRDTGPDDFIHNLQTLPRFDCNQFPHGKASGVPTGS